MSKRRPISGDRFIYEGDLYELMGQNSVYWSCKDVERDIIAIHIKHDNWQRAIEFFDDYIPAQEEVKLPEELFKI